jgi:ceramide glucosyltransferase
MLRRLLAIAVPITAIAAIAYTAVAIACAARFARREAEDGDDLPPASLLIPLRGAEPGLEENLRAFVEQDYAEYQVLVGVANADDPALPIALRVAASFPDRSIDIAVGAATSAPNPKIANVLSMMRFARHDVLVLADSDTRVDRSYLRSVVLPLRRAEIGLVTCLFAGVPYDTFASKLGAMFINDQFIPSALVDRLFGPLRHGFGPTNALRRSVLESIGGFEALASHLADDFMLGHFVAARGLRVAISQYVVRTIVSEPTLRALWEHELRWHRTIRNVAPIGYAGMFLTYPIPLALLCLTFSRRRLFSTSLVAAAFAARILLQRVSAHALRVAPSSPWLVLSRDLFGFALWARGLTGRSVRWRGTQLRLIYGDILAECISGGNITDRARGGGRTAPWRVLAESRSPGGAGATER